MMRSRLRRTLPLLTALAGLACLSAAASAVDISEILNFKGTVTDIGVQRGPGQIGGIEYRIEGKFVYTGPLDLTHSTVTFHNLFDEHLPADPNAVPPLPAGNGEMVLTTDNADLVCPEDPVKAGCVPLLAPLVSSSSSKPTEAKYETPARFRPQMRVQIKGKEGLFQFNVRLDRGLSPQVPPVGDADPARQFPQRCVLDPTGETKRFLTEIRTSFTISDGHNEPVVLDFVKNWECAQAGRYHLRSR